MIRYTKRDNNGAIQVAIIDFYPAMRLLCDYEDLELPPEEIKVVLDNYGRGLTLRATDMKRLEIIRGIPTDKLQKMAQEMKAGSQEEIKPCPYCKGEEAKVVSDDVSKWVVCPRCGATGPCEFAAAEAIDDWNKVSRKVLDNTGRDVQS